MHRVEPVGPARGHVQMRLVLAAALVLCSCSVWAQTPTGALVTEWDLHAATGGGSSGSQNVAAVLLDVSGIAGPAGHLWVTTQSPLPRLGRLDPTAPANNYVEWRPVPSSMGGGPPLGLALNRSNGDLWVTVQGDPSFLVKLGGTNTFRRFRSASPLVPHGVVVAGDHAAIAALPNKNSAGVGNAIVKVPRNPTGGSVTITLWNVGGEPHHVALDNNGHVWFSQRETNVLARLNLSTGAVTEWPLPAGSRPAGVFVAGNRVCVASEGTPGGLDGIAHCLDASTNQITTYARATGGGFDYPQQVVANADGELLLTEQNGNAVSFVAYAARAAAAVTTVAPTTRTVKPSTSTLSVSDATVSPATYTAQPSDRTMTGDDNGAGYVRFTLPLVPLTYPFEIDGHPQPVALTSVFSDQGRGTGSVFFGQYFNGPRGKYVA
ncbi:MAG TPA: hypothetical protein VNI78_03920, partial [Vicinamibacterales bacterium]|nr:hypothetical protein [Vicinamibacterales bacterium]